MCICFELLRKQIEIINLDDFSIPSVVGADSDASDKFFPGMGIPVIVQEKDRKLDIFYWGLIPSWAKDIGIGRATFNARAETIHEKPSFRNAFKRRRCLIPASGFYETNKHRQNHSHYFFFPSERHAMFTFAGLWEYWMDPNGSEVYSATIVTCPANVLVGQVHDRMPVILSGEKRQQWLAGGTEKDMLALLNPADQAAMGMKQVPDFRKQ